ncbi:Hypothetical Protein FCC1311_039632 [Hondaea fermentalgiana]|uniref:Cytidyltransferase-like domain-containing protein n=1 Tax=Hondaea fermentalgiana TaxID=2315210 RepID=A0A2R5G9M5_9STRA|nr:Hypothetical Protein FCC1311_039632 [Hondaea fermentalgiana]|eukprot:GBG27740.1 Hypothetical Protein FCC1311_039632 [Hondaea fermentalgiana]
MATAGRQRVAIFGSSVDPPTGTGGHLGLVSFLASKFDGVLVLPVYEHIFDSKRSRLAPFEHRVEMAKRCFAGVEGKVEVSLVEKEVAQLVEAGQRVGTYDVLEHLRKIPENKNRDFVLALGGDTFADIVAGKWKNGNEILASTEIAVISRPGVAATEYDPSKVKGVCFYEMPRASDVSSTAAREACAVGDEETLAKHLHPDVVAYIKANKLYGYGHEAENAEAPAPIDAT